MAEVDTLKDRVRKLYTIMNSFCRRVSEALRSRRVGRTAVGGTSSPSSLSTTIVTLVKGAGFGTGPLNVPQLYLEATWMAHSQTTP